ncbi:hypothetical protein Pla52o_35860 [Novipirellula galeiformis]|uniref:DUF1573 domain-containing protein n=1 Tax=Novipirellula galeiformis TaxID=2528004 RepID=A0A5C6CFK0_9BACT|nr:DUF1573 domain-containing protein [Novipirellula galeiformis]TWU22527.1 hypothetical protein Pla52o_35860 [Novipirellula galeiformis]
MFTLRSTGPRILLGCLGMMLACSLALTIGSQIKYKPYGVPDHRRSEYDTILRKLAKQSQAIAEAKLGKNPIAKLEQSEYDFGLLAPGTAGAKHDFLIHNEGQDDLVLSSVGSSCKCTVATIEDRIVPPGESRPVTLVWNVGEDLSDEYEQTALIETNDPSKPRIELKVRGRVRSRWAVSSSDLVHLKGSAHRAIEASCILYSQVFEDFVILETESSSGAIQVATEPADPLDLSPLQGRCGYKVNIHYRAPTKHTGHFQEQVRVCVLDTQTEATEWMELPIRGTIGKPLIFHGPELDASGLDLGTVEVGDKREWSFFVRFRTENIVTDAVVRKVAPPGLVAAVEPVKRVKNTFRVTLKLATDAKPHRFYFDEQGYVEISNRDDPTQGDWMSLSGQIISPANKSFVGR